MSGIQHLGFYWHLMASGAKAMAVPNRRRTDQIREICARMLRAAEDELPALNSQLQEALIEHSLHLENIAVATVLGWPDFPIERRSRASKVVRSEKVSNR